MLMKAIIWFFDTIQILYFLERILSGGLGVAGSWLPSCSLQVTLDQQMSSFSVTLTSKQINLCKTLRVTYSILCVSFVQLKLNIYQIPGYLNISLALNL